MTNEIPHDDWWSALPTYLRSALEPIGAFLARADVVEISINGPGSVWIETLGSSAMECHSVPELDAQAIRFMAQQVASGTNQAVNEEMPLLSAALPHGERFQAVLAPAAPNGGAISIRKQVITNLSLSHLGKTGGLDVVRFS
jgi:type IV secretion system protein VirB11